MVADEDEPTEVPELSAVVLCYRAGDGAHRVVEPLYDMLGESGVSFEMVLVANYHSDPSEDDTAEVVAGIAEQRPQVRTVVRQKQGDMGWDMRSGFEAARGDFIVAIDGDEQNPVEDVLEAYNQLKLRRADVVKGRRIARFDGYYRHITSIGYNAIFHVLFGTRGLWDINAKPKGFTRSAYEQMNLTADDWFIDAEIVLEAQRCNLRLIEMPVVFRQNADRASFVRGSAIREFMGNMLERWRGA